MEEKQLFKAYYSRLAKEGMIKSLILGLCTGFLLSLVPVVAALVIYMVALPFAIVFGVVGFVAATPAFYYLFFRPKTSQILKRLDRLGLEERLVTMKQFENDDSYIAMRQREDAKQNLQKVSPKKLKVRMFKIPIVMVALLMAVSITAVTLSHLSVPERPTWATDNENGYIDYTTYTLHLVSYRTWGQGDIVGEMDQVVVDGQNGTAVVAVPRPGFAFFAWSDELTRSSSRMERAVTQDVHVFAIFVLIQGGVPQPRDPEFEESDFILDDETHFGNVFDEFYDRIIDLLIDGWDDLSPAQLRMIELYIMTLRAVANAGE